jgi:hypothetical protein
MPNYSTTAALIILFSFGPCFAQEQSLGSVHAASLLLPATIVAQVHSMTDRAGILQSLASKSREGPETLEATFSSAGLPTFAITLDNKVHVSLVARSRRFDPSCFPTPEQAARAGYLRLTTGATTPMQAVERPRGRGYTSNDQCRRRSAAKSHAIALKSPFRDLSEVLTHAVRGRNLESVRGAGGLGCGDFQRHCRGVSGLSTAGQPRGSRKRMCDPSLRNAAYGFTYDHPCSCNSITLTTPELTVCACGIRGMSFSSAFFIFS